MTKQEFRSHATPERILALIGLLALFLASVGFERKSDHDRDINRVERKLDCALFELPKGCKDTMSPREP
jgi:hypothetical protein